MSSFTKADQSLVPREAASDPGKSRTGVSKEKASPARGLLPKSVKKQARAGSLPGYLGHIGTGQPGPARSAELCWTLFPWTLTSSARQPRAPQQLLDAVLAVLSHWRQQIQSALAVPLTLRDSVLTVQLGLLYRLGGIERKKKRGGCSLFFSCLFLVPRARTSSQFWEGGKREGESRGGERKARESRPRAQ